MPDRSIDVSLSLPRSTIVDARSRREVERAEATLFRNALRRGMTCSTGDAFLRIGAADMGRLRLASIESSGHLVRLVEAEDVTLLRPVQGTITVATARRPMSIGPGQSLLLATGERTTTVSADFHGLVALLPQAQLGETMNAIAGDRSAGDLEAPTILDAEHPAATALDSFLLELFRRVGEPAVGGNAMWAKLAGAHALAALLAGAVLEGGPVAAPAAPSQVRRAEELLRARAREPVSIAELCRELQVGLRALQLAFRHHRGTTPQRFLRDCRLDLAREHLRRGDEPSSVTSVALDCGFTHVGRFAAAYRARYGEPPMATLRHSRVAREATDSPARRVTAA